MAIDPRRLPFIGNGIANIGQVYDTLSTPCSPTPEVWFLAFWHGVPQLVYTHVKPDPVDFLTQRFGRSHKLTRKRRFNVKGRVLPQVPVTPGLGWAAFSAVKLMERVGWYVLVFDSLTEFAVNWTSTAYEWSGCRVRGTPYTEGWLKDTKFEPPTTEWQIQLCTEVRSNIFHQEGYDIYIPAGYKASVFASFGTRQDNTYKGGISAMKIVDRDSGKTIAGGDVLPSHNNFQSGSAVFRNWYTNTGDRYYRLYLKPDGKGYVQIPYLRFGAYGAEDSPLLADP